MPSLTFLLQLNHSKGWFATPFDSTAGIPTKILVIVYAIFFVFGLYVYFKVRKMIKDDKKDKR